MSNYKPVFRTVIKTSISSITKHPWNISPTSKCNTNQGRITSKSCISKSHLLSFLHSMYNSIKLNNQSSLNFKKRWKSTNKFSHTPTKNTYTSSKIRIPLAIPSVLILTQPDEGNSRLTGREQRTFSLRVLLPKKLNHVGIQNIIFH